MPAAVAPPPKAPVQPSTTPNPPTEQPDHSAGGMDDSFADIAALAEPSSPPNNPEPPAQDPTPDKVNTQPKTDKTATPPAKAADKGKPAATKDEPPAKVNELRTAYEKTKAEAEQLRNELAQAKADGASKKELDSIRAEFDKLKKEREELASEIRYAKYEKSPEYNDTYVKPLHKAFKDAYESMAELQVDEGGTERTANEDDFNSILNLPLGQAVKKAKELFGDASTVVLNHRQAVLTAEHARKEALSNWKTKAEERDRTLSEQQQQFVASTKTRFNTYQDTMAKKYPDLYSPSAPDAEGKPTDPEGDELLSKGDALVKKAFGLSEDKLTHEQMTDAQAELAIRARSFGRLKLQNNRLAAKVKELEEKLASYSQAEPGGGDGRTDTRTASGSWEDQSDAEISALADQTR